MFSSMFQELSVLVSPSLVNSFKVTNLRKNGIHIPKFGETHHFWVQNLAEFYFTLKFHESKIRTIIPKYYTLNSKTKFLKIPGKSTKIFPKLLKFPQDFFKIFNQNFLGKLTKIFPNFLRNFLNNYWKVCL